MLVKIKPLDKERWHGKTGKESFTQPTKIKALYDVSTGRYATGLKEKDRERLEKLTGFNLSDLFNPNQPHEFWDSEAATLVLPNHTIVLNLDVPLDEIKYYIARASKFVANSEQEYLDGYFPEATHVIFDEEEQIKIKASKAQLKMEAYKLALKMTKQFKQNLIVILGEKSMSKASNEAIDVEIENLIENKTKEFVEYATKDKSYIANRALIKLALMQDILVRSKGNICYMDDVLGSSIDEAADFISDSKNQSYKTIILNKLQ